MRTSFAVATAVAFASQGSLAQQGGAATFTVSKADGGSARTELGYGITVNKGSSLRRQAVTVHDGKVPVKLDQDVIVRTTYTSDSYYYTAAFAVTASEPLAAIEIRFILFDVFGERVKVLSSTDVVDLPAGAPKTLEAKWRAWTENEVSDYLASIAFVVRVRTQTGQVINADLAPVLTEANKFAKKLTIADLEPKPDPKP